MKRFESIANTVDYGRRLVNAGVSGIRASEAATARRSPSKILAESACDSLTLAAIATCIGLVTARSRRIPKGLVLGAAGFCAGLAWGTRSIASTLASAAAREMQKVSDEHWLQTHPIDYA
jgi:hypothetical protein